ncbi:MAG: 6-bladed beta-propeller [Balneolaceae bacterium]
MLILIKIQLLLILILAGCSKGEIQESPDSITENNQTISKKGPAPDSLINTEIQFEKDLVFGTTDEVIVGTVGPFAVDEKDRVFIGDISQTTVHVFNPDGSFLTSLGRQGKGPGEFSYISKNTTLTIHSDKVFVTDTYGFYPHRAQVFSLKDLSFSHTMNLIGENMSDFDIPKSHGPKQLFPRNDGMFLVPYHQSISEYQDSENTIQYVIQDGTGKIIKGPLLKQKGLIYLNYTYTSPFKMTMRHAFPFYGKTLFTVSNEDQMYVANTEVFEIFIYDNNGKYIRSIQYPFENQKLNLDKLVDHYKEINYMSQYDRDEGDQVAIKMIRNAQNIPETWPALETMFFDNENRLWISTIIDEEEVYEWWVLKDTGEIITKFKWPREKPVKLVNNSYLYTQETNEMEVASIVRYRFELN